MKLLMIALLAFACSISAAAADDRIAAGKKIYLDKCASCHAQDGSGNVPRGKTMKVPDLRNAALQDLTDKQLIKGILEAKRHPSFKTLATDDHTKVIAYMRTLKE